MNLRFAVGQGYDAAPSIVDQLGLTRVPDNSVVQTDDREILLAALGRSIAQTARDSRVWTGAMSGTCSPAGTCENRVTGTVAASLAPMIERIFCFARLPRTAKRDANRAKKELDALVGDARALRESLHRS